MSADLNDPTSIPAALVGIHTIIDCCTARPEESTQKIDWEGKVALIQAAQVSLPFFSSPPYLPASLLATHGFASSVSGDLDTTTAKPNMMSIQSSDHILPAALGLSYVC